VTHGKLAVLTDVWVQTDDIYIMDFFSLLNFVVCLCGLGSTPVQGISDIYWRILDIGARKEFNFEVRIFTQEFSKLAPPDENNFITSVFNLL